MERDTIADNLEEIAYHLTLADVPEYEIPAYFNAADTVRNVDEIPAEPSSLDGIGDTISKNISQMRERGTCDKLERLRSERPWLGELVSIEGVGAKTAQKMYSQEGIDGLDALRVAIEDGSITDVSGIGPATADNLEEALAEQAAGVSERIPLADAEGVYRRVVSKLEEDLAVERTCPAGSLRRKQETVGDVDVLIETHDVDYAFDAVEELASRILGRGDTKLSAIVDGFQVDVRAVPRESFGAAKQYFTGSKTHNIAVRKHAQAKGWKLNEYGLFDSSGDRIAGKTERDIYSELDLPYVKPSERTGQNVPPLKQKA